MLGRLWKKQPPDAEFEQSKSLKHRAIRGSIWSFIGHGTGQVLRLGSNLILTRLLFPEAFGLMALVQTFLIGLEMFSDIGVVPSIIQNKRGNDPAFLNTAWTIQAMRGCMLWICACIIAFPAAQFYKEPMLTQLLPVVGLTAIIAGLNSTKLATSNRRLSLGKLTLVDLSSQIFGLVITIVGAWIYPSVWALVVGGLVSTVTRMVLSHIVLEGERNRFHWEPEAFRELYQFGRWIFFSTLLTFFAGQGDRLILARLLDVRFLGIYTVALTMSRTLGDAINQVGGQVLFPSFAELIRERPEQLYSTLRKCRLMMICANWAASLMFIALGAQLIDFLYDDRYAEAGWILKIFSIGALVGVLGQSYDNVLLAKGKTFAITALLVIQITMGLALMFLGAHWAGQRGVILGLACNSWLSYPFQAICMKRLSIWQPEVDLPVIAMASGVAAFTFLY